MQITKLDTLDLTANGITAMLTDKSKAIEYDNRRRQRSDASAFVGSSIRPGEWHVLVTLPTPATRDALIAALDTDLTRERRLEATINSVTVEGYAALRRITLPYMARSAELTFEPTFPTWRAVTAVTTSYTLTAADTITATVGGNTRVAPLIRIKPTVQHVPNLNINGHFDVSINGWTANAPPAGMTVNRYHETTVTQAGAGSHGVQILTNSTAGAKAATSDSISFSCRPGQLVAARGYVLVTGHVSLRGDWAIVWQNAAGVTIRIDAATSPSTTDVWHYVPVTGTAPAGARSFVIRLIGYSLVQDATGFVLFDSLLVDAGVGWTRRSRYRITNSSDETWYRHPMRINLGDTTGIVTAGRALASGNDVRVWLHGREVARTLTGWNTASTFAWIIVPVLRPNASIDYDVMWGNSSAYAPPVLAYPDAPAFDIATSTNGLWRYQSTGGNGVWYLSSGTTPPVIDQDVPGSWRALMTLPNPDNVDDVSQAPYYLSGGTYRAPFYARRGIAGGLNLPNEGLADGISLHHPCGIASVNGTFSYRNDLPTGNFVTPLGRFVILIRGSGAQGWNILFERADAQHVSTTTITRTTYSAAAPVKNLALAVWPEDGIAVVEATAAGNMIEVKSLNYMDVAIDDTKIGITLIQAETEVYEVATVLSVDPNDGYTTANELRLGAAGSTGSLDAPRLAVELYQIVILDGETRTAEVWDSALTAKVETLPNFAVRAVRLQDVQGVATTFPTSEWLPMRPTPAGVPLTISESNMGTLAVDVLVAPNWIP